MEKEFTEWFEKQGFRNFKAHEFTWYFSKVRNGVKNKYPAKSLWPNIIPTLRILDDLRDHFKKPVNISSTYRDLPYNRAVGSPDGSLHVKFNAIDFTVSGVAPSAVYKKLLEWRNAGKWVGGLGKYATFTHIDTRSKNATW